MTDTKRDEKVVLDGVGSETAQVSSKMDELEKRVDPETEKQAEENVKKVMDFSLSDHERMDAIKASVGNIAAEVEKESQKFSPMLQATVQRLAKDTEGGVVANALVDLKLQIEDLDPAKVDFTPGWVSRKLGFLPFVGKPLKRYFTKYESAQTVIAAILNSLNKGKEELERDNKTLKMDQQRMRALCDKLTKAIAVSRLMDEKIAYKVEREMDQNSEEAKFIKEEVLFPLRQRIMDLQQTLSVNQQGVIALEVIMKNNLELIKGAGRTAATTVQALSTASVCALALANQRIVLDKINMIQNTANSMIASTANMLKTQGVEIQKQATEAQLNVEVLKQAFRDVNDAMEQMARYKVESLGKMNATINEMSKLNEEAKDRIVDMEKGNKVRAKVIDLDVK